MNLQGFWGVIFLDIYILSFLLRIQDPAFVTQFHESHLNGSCLLPKDLSMEQLDVEYLNFHHTVMQDKNNLKTQGMTDRQKKLKMRAEEAIYSSMFVSESKTTDFRNVAHLLARTAAQSSCEAVTEGKNYL